MKVLILGIDGYLGWTLAVDLALKGHEIAGMDNLFRRNCVEKEMKSQSATPIVPILNRANVLEKLTKSKIWIYSGSLYDYGKIDDCLDRTRPDAIVHLAEIPSAPYSMIDSAHAGAVHTNNVIGTLNLLYAMKERCPDAHLIKLGTMGEYGQPDVDIPEGFFDIEYRGRKATLPFPRQAGSWYHQTKVHDSNNVAFACKIWGLRSTDVMQGVVYGVKVPAMGDDSRMLTRFDFDECFGTVINRFCAQAVAGLPLTPYGSGKQRRGFLSIKDSMQCLNLILENPPTPGEYRVFNQFAETFTPMELAEKIASIGKGLGISPAPIIKPVDNPRIEAEDHYFNPICEKLPALGFKQTMPIDREIIETMGILKRYKSRIVEKQDCIMPKVKWSQ